MIKKILFITLITISSTIIQTKQIEDARWETITIDISKDGDPEDRGEFEVAVQALKNIDDDGSAKSAAKAINRRWGKSTNADIKKEAQVNALLALKRYPTMDAATVKQETKNLFQKPNIDAFLQAEGIKVTLP